MEFTKVSSWIDLDSTNAEKEAFKKMVEDVIAKIKSVGKIEVALGGAQSSKDAIKLMGDLSREQAKLAKSTKDYEKILLDNLRAEKLAASASKDTAAAKKLQAQATNEASKANLNEAKTTTESAKAKKIQLDIEARVNKEKDKTQKALDRENKNVEKLSNAYEQLKAKYNIAANSAKRIGAEEGTNSENFKQSAAAAQLYYQQLVKIEEAVGQSQRQVGQYKNATFALNQVLREAPAFANSFATGISGISNNIPQLIDQIKILKEQTGSNAKAFGILAKSLFSFTALLPIGFLLVQTFGKEISDFFSTLFTGKKSLDQAALSAQKLNEAFSDNSYKDAVKNVNELRINIDLAKQGFLSKEKVLKQYNETLGGTIGEASSLNEAEQLLIKNGDAYVKMTLYKAAANLALEEAAKKAIQIEQDKLKKEKDFATGFDKGKTGLINELIPVIPFGDSRAERYEKAIQKEGEKRKAAALKEAEKAQKDNEDIAKKFQEDAAKLSQQFNLNFFDDKGDKTKQDKSKLEDFSDNLAKQAQERLKIANEITRTRLEGEAAALMANAQKERKIYLEKGETLESYTARQAAALQEQIDGYQSYYNKVLELTQFNTKAQIAELDAKTAEEKSKVQADLDDKTKKLTTKQRADLQATLVEIDKKAAAEKELIVLQGNQALLDFDRSYEKQITDATKAGLDERAKARLEYFEKLKEELKKELEFQQNNLTVLQASDVEALNKQLRDQVISVKQYQEQKLKLAKTYAKEELDNQISYFEELLKATATTEDERLAIEAKIAELRLKKDQEITDEKINNLTKVREAEKRLGNEALAAFTSIVSGRYEKEKNDIQDQIDLLEEKKAKDIEVAQQTSANAAEAADRVKIIEARAAAQKEALTRRQRQVDQERARFERMVEVGRIVASTAVGVANALSGPPPAPPNPLLAGIIAATGALQLARVLATPIPRYAQGLDEADRDHVAFVGDGGRRELVKYPDGSSWITPDRPTLAFIPKGAQVIPDLDKAAATFTGLAPGFSTPTQTDQVARFAGVVKREMSLTRKAIQSKRENYFSIINGQISAKTKDGFNETDYLNKNLDF
jgi:hypothetical protein